jgi:hypothetical protein
VCGCSHGRGGIGRLGEKSRLGGNGGFLPFVVLYINTTKCQIKSTMSVYEGITYFEQLTLCPVGLLELGQLISRMIIVHLFVSWASHTRV